MSPSSGKSFEILNPDWFVHNGLKAGDVLELRYQMTYSGDKMPSVTSLKFDGNDLCSSSTSGTETTTASSTEATTEATSSGSGKITIQILNFH